MLDAVKLRTELGHMIQQRDNALIVFRQAEGAISALEWALKEMEEPDSMTVQELAEALGAKSAEIIPNADAAQG
jgi:hypothetical protein